MRSMTGCGRCQLMRGGYEVTVAEEGADWKLSLTK